MKSKRLSVKWLWIILGILLVIGILIQRGSKSELFANSGFRPVSDHSTPNPDGSPEAKADVYKSKVVIGQIEKAFAAPNSFYGRVIDQNGDPVEGAKIGYSPIDSFLSSNTSYSGVSDSLGSFSIKDIKGIALSVGVGKPGYYPVDDKYDNSPSSSATFAYGIGPDSCRRSPPTKETPAIFLLHKIGETVPLVKVSRIQVDVPKTGAPLSMDFTTGRLGGKDLTLESWTGPKVLNRFDWTYRMSVSGGGLVERKGEFEFEAPTDGYHPQIEVKMPADCPQWASRISKEYFMKLPDNRYARFTIRFYPGDRSDDADRNFVVLESFLNPTPGDRNLEFDPAKAISTP